MMASLEELEAAKKQMDEAHEDLMRYIEDGVTDSHLHKRLAACRNSPFARNRAW